MLRPDEIAQQTDELSLDQLHSPHTLDPLPRTAKHRRAPSGKRLPAHHHILQQQETGPLTSEFDVTPSTDSRSLARRPSNKLRENKHLRSVLAQQQTELEKSLQDRDQLKTEFEKEIESAQNGYQQTIDALQLRLQEVIVERDHLFEEHARLEQQNQEAQHSLQQTINLESRRQVEEGTRALFEAPNSMPAVFQDVARTIELRLRQEEEKHLIETLYLKSEVERVAELLEQERIQLQAERQQLISLQYSIREQAETRQKALNDRLRTRWKAASVMTTLGVLVLLVILQFVALALLRVHLEPTITFAIIAPIVISVILAFLLAIPLANLRQIYLSAPHRQKAKQNS